eukprot:g5377.t1
MSGTLKATNQIREDGSDLEEGEIADETFHGETEDGLEEGELPIPPVTKVERVNESSGEASHRGLKPIGANSTGILDSSGLNNEMRTQHHDEESKIESLISKNTKRIEQRLKEFEELIGRQKCVQKGNYETIAKHMFRVMDYEQRNYRLDDSKEGVSCLPRTHRMTNKGTKLLEQRRKHRHELRSIAKNFDIHLKASPVTSVYPEDSLLDPFVPQLPRVHHSKLIEMSMESNGVNGDPRVRFKDELNDSMKRKRLLVTEMAENKLFRKIEEQNLKRRRVNFGNQSSKVNRPNWRGVDKCSFGELMTEPKSTDDVRLDFYRNLSPSRAETEVKIGIHVEPSSDGVLSKTSKVILKTLGLETPTDLAAELVDDILNQIRNIDARFDLRKVEEMETRLSSMLRLTKVYTNPSAVDFVLRVISSLKGDSSKKHTRVQMVPQKGSIVALEVQPGGHHQAQLVDEIKKDVIRSLLRDDFLNKEVAKAYSEFKRDSSLVEDHMEVDRIRYRPYQRPSVRNNFI